MSCLTKLNKKAYNGQQYETFALEYSPGKEPNGSYIAWSVGEARTWNLDSRALRPSGHVGWRVVPREPLAIVANVGTSQSFSPISLPQWRLLLPATMRIDYVRIYQKTGDEHYLSCDPPGYNTTAYIAGHPRAYSNHNYSRG